MNGRHHYYVKVREGANYLTVIANCEHDAIEIAKLTDKCEQLEQKVKELSEQLPDVEHDYTYAPT
jgi:DNA-binding protein YbaB